MGASRAFPSNCYKLLTSTTSRHQISTLWIPATAKQTHLATATHATIVASALAIRPLAIVTSRAVRNERNKYNNNNIFNVNMNPEIFWIRLFWHKENLTMSLPVQLLLFLLIS